MTKAQLRAAQLAALALTLTACDIEAKLTKQLAALQGRVFSADDGKPLANVEVVLPDGTKTMTDSSGRFQATSDAKNAGSVTVKGGDSAPVSKATPERGGYLEVYAKRYDDSADSSGGAMVAVSTKQGAKATVPGGGLRQKGGGSQAANAHVAIAAPDPRKPTDLPSLPGDFDAKKGGKSGKVSAESPVHIAARDGDKELELAPGNKVSVDFPVRRADRSDEGELFRFDDEQQRWEHVGSVPRMMNDAGQPVYHAEVDALSWWTVGEFFDTLTCVRACVVDKAGDGVPFARAVASGVDHFTQVTQYAGEDGCFAIDVRASAQISLKVQALDGFVAPQLVQTSAKAASAKSDPSQCQDLGKLKLEEAKDEACPLGLKACGDKCVDLRADGEHCGSCDTSCGGSEGRELSCVDGLCQCPLGQRPCEGEQGSSVPTMSSGGPDGAASGSGGDTAADAGTAEVPDASAGGTPRPAGGAQRAQLAGYCAAVRTDSQNCGACGNHCAQGESCIDGVCGRVADKPAGNGGSTGMGSIDADAGVDSACGGCPGTQINGIQVAGCCTELNMCGLETKDLPFSSPLACLARAPISPDKTCPSVQSGEVMFAGCCLQNRLCGANTIEATFAGKPVSYELGCQAYQDVGVSAEQTTCGGTTSLPDAGTGLACDPCPDMDLGPAGIAMGCCTGTNACGSLVSAMYESFGFKPNQCVERNQPGTVNDVCPSLTRMNVDSTLTMPGCCRADGQCGYNADQTQVTPPGVGYKLGTGCISYADANDATTPASCGVP